VSSSFFLNGGVVHPPTLEDASVKLFRVVLLPLDGLPTKPIKGSRGIVVFCKEAFWPFDWSMNIVCGGLESR
jgi:hypothetical protein